MSSFSLLLFKVQKHPCINKAKTKRHVKIQHIQVSRNKPKHVPPLTNLQQKTPALPTPSLSFCKKKQENKTEQN